MKTLTLLALTTVLVLSAVSCNYTATMSKGPDGYRIVKDGNNEYWVEVQGWFFDGETYRKSGWICINPCVYYDDQESAEKQVEQILKSKEKTVIKTVYAK
uniref:Uncharacterized protein n=1 Tax=viral metagenome TaxID=1070528 RepID=A0A6M3LLC0_9ZZZZ